jgi:hypothetical protein
MRQRKRINGRDWIPVTVAAKVLGVEAQSLYSAIHRGKLRVRVEQIQRLRVQLKDAKAFLDGRNPVNVETGRMAAEKRAERKAAGKRPTRTKRSKRYPNGHPGRTPRPSETTVLQTHTQTKIRTQIPKIEGAALYDLHLARHLVVSRDAGTEPATPDALRDGR